MIRPPTAPADAPTDAGGLRQRMHDVIFRHDTPAGKTFDLAVLTVIALSVIAVCVESVPAYHARYGRFLHAVEWGFTILFTIEYAARLYCVKRPLRYATSFFGLVDLLALLPSYLSLIFVGTQTLIVIRALRLLRVFRILKLTEYTGEATLLIAALRTARHKITVFMFTVLIIVPIVGALMYLIEGPESGFDSIPMSCYWTIVTMTTVGYGDIAPQTPPGRFVASALMLLGYGIIAVPTGIVTAELVSNVRKQRSNQVCTGCHRTGHEVDANFCKFCGGELMPGEPGGAAT